MRKTTHFHCHKQHCHKQPFVTRQDVIHILILIALSLLFCLIPKYGLGQPMPGSISDNFPAFGSSSDSVPPPITATPEPAPTAVPPAIPEISLPEAASVNPRVEDFYAPSPTAETPDPAAAAASPLIASQYQPLSASPSSYQPQQSPVTPRLPQNESAIPAEHPFRAYWGVPNDLQTSITGKPMTVAELFTGTRSSAVRCQLLQAYWELSGLLAVYHFRCETEKQASEAGGAENMMTLLREQRRTAELEFIKQQWVLAELLKQCKGRMLRESELPIPADFPLYPHYRTFADQIARTERTRYLGRMIPIQEQLIESKNGTWRATSALSASQPFLTVLDQRTAAFLDLTKAIIEYNRMIAEYATETIPPNVSPQQLAGAVVRLPKRSAERERPQNSQAARQEISLTGYEYYTAPCQ